MASWSEPHEVGFVVISLWSRTLDALKRVFNDALYRNSLILLANTVVTSAIGFVFWALAARSYPASIVGVFSSVISAVALLAAIAALGLPTTMIRHVASSENARGLVIVAIIAIATVGTALCLITVLVLGPHLPPALHLRQGGGMVLLVTGLVVCTAVSTTLDACLVATRSSHAVFIKNLAGSTVKVAALILLTSFRSSGLLISYSLGLVLATAMSSLVLNRRIGRGAGGFESFRELRHYLSMASGTYLATVMGILPITVVPLEVLAIRGAAETAHFAVAFLIAGFLNFVPSTIAQVLFAEASRRGATIGKQLRKAIRGIYGLLLPSLAIVIPAAPLLLRLFGIAYANAATGCLRVLALSTLFTGGTYLIDSLLIARDRTAAYIFMNGANAVLVLGCVGVLLPRGLTAGAVGWAIGQGLSLILGVLVLPAGRAGRHHPKVEGGPRRHQLPQPVVYTFEPQIRKLLATWPMMPTTLIAEQIGWDQSISALLERVTELRSEYSHSYQDLSRVTYLAGETAQCGLWFPPTEVPVAIGQARSAQQLPVLTMITGYSRWLLAMLIPSEHTNDLIEGLWQILTTLGAVPKILTWDSPSATSRWAAEEAESTNRYTDFCHALGARLIVDRSSDPKTRGLVERAHAYMEGSFLSGRTFTSPMDFNRQLHDWLDKTNTRPRQLPNRSPTELICTDKKAMLPLPAVAPTTGWQLSMKAEGNPFLCFDSNAYSIDPTLIGQQIELLADLNRVRVLYHGKIVAQHNRSWARGLTISDPDHVAAANATLRRKGA
jgi:O-antigen/teichoic acid export membrane protein/transposase